VNAARNLKMIFQLSYSTWTTSDDHWFQLMQNEKQPTHKTCMHVT